MPPVPQAGGAMQTGADYILTGDVIIPLQRQPIVDLSVDGIIVPISGIVRLTKGSAAAMTLRAPTADEAGRELVITAGSAFAHVVTATGLIQNGVVGGAKTTMTFGAFVGSSITLVSVTTTGATTGTWYVKALNVVVVT